MTMSQEFSDIPLTPEQEFAEAKDEADQVFAEFGFEIAKLIINPTSLTEIAQRPKSNIQPPKELIDPNTRFMQTALTNYVDTIFDSLAGDDYDVSFNGQPEFKRVVNALSVCPHKNKTIVDLKYRYSQPFDNLKENFEFIIGRFMGAYQLIGEHAIDPEALVTAQKPHRQIAKLRTHQEQRAYKNKNDQLINAIRPAWDEQTEQLRIMYPGGMPAVRKLIDATIASEASQPEAEDPRISFDYKRGCAALRKPEGETDDTFNMMWGWCVAAVTDPRLQHLLGAKS